MLEYALLIALISIAVVAILIFLGPRISSYFSRVNTETAEAVPVSR